MSTLFISDLHLSAEQPHVTTLLLELIDRHTTRMEALYILGDLFEAWLGDDAVLPEYQPVIDALRRLHEKNIPVFVMHGNRDFLLGKGFETLTRCRLLEDAAVIDLYGTPTLVMHGDALCTDDVEYQQFRTMVRNKEWQTKMLALSVAERIRMAGQLRDSSKAATGAKMAGIMDANERAIEEEMRNHGVRQLIHGHTHRPAIHRFTLDGQPATRIVLGDWQNMPSLLLCDATGCRLEDARITASCENTR